MVRSQGLSVVAGGPQGPCYVTIDEHAAGQEMGQHLHDMGHDLVCILTGPVAHTTPKPSITTWNDYIAGQKPDEPWQRLTGLATGLNTTSLVIAQATHWTRTSGAEAVAAALDRYPHLSAIACAGDSLALGALDALHTRGLIAGRDLAVTGFDGTDDAEEHGLTTIDAHAREQGTRAAQLLLDPSLQPRRVVLDHHLILRQSSSRLTIPS